jgi:hypothetical protein
MVMGRHFKMISLLALGDIAAVDEEIAAITRLAEESRQRPYLWQAAQYPVMRAMLRGQIAEAERLAAQALAIGQQARQENAAQMFGAQMFAVRYEQGGSGLEAPTKRSSTDAAIPPGALPGAGLRLTDQMEKAKAEFESWP